MYNMLKNKIQGFSLVEMQIAMVISVIVILAIGFIASISNNTYNKVRQEAELYNDISHTIKMIQNRVHAAQSASVITTVSNPWGSPRLIIDNSAFGIYILSSQERALVFLPDKDDASGCPNHDGTTCEVLISTSNVLNNLLTDPIERDVLTLTITSSTNYYTLVITGRKDKIPFNFQVEVLRRVK